MWRAYTQNTLPVARWKNTIGDYLLYDLQFLEIWREVGVSPVYFIDESSENAENTPVFAALRKSSGPLRRYQTLIDGLPGRIISGSQQGSGNSQVFAGALGVMLEQGGVKHVWVDYDNAVTEDSIGPEWTSSSVTTQVVEREVMCDRAFDSATARHIRSGKERGGVVAQLVNVEDATKCYAIVCDTERRRGSKPRYPEPFYRKLAALSMEDSRIFWLLCRAGDEIIGFHICLQIGDELLSWQPYMDYRHRELKPAYLLMNEVFSIAHNRNAKRINLGGSPASATGLREFKRRFGAVEYQYNIYTHLSPTGKVFSRVIQ